MEEIWKPINGFDGYEISNFGRVKSLKYNREVIRKFNLNRDGYYYISLTEEGISYTKKVHRLVCEHFCEGKTEDKSHVDHIDGDKLNNYSNNLRWCTHAENIRYAFDMGIYKKKGMDHHLSILTDDNVIEIKKRLSKGEKAGSIHNDYGVKINAIYDIKQGRTWKHV